MDGGVHPGDVEITWSRFHEIVNGHSNVFKFADFQ